MTQAPSLTAREYEPVDLRGLADPKGTRDELLLATAGLREEALRLDRRGRLHTRGLVGLVQTRNVSLQILPKVRSGSGAPEDAIFLLRLLTAARLVPQRLVSPGHVGSGQLPLLEMFMRATAEHMQYTLGAHGLPRRYADVREDRETIVGVVDMERAMRQMPNERHRVPVIHAPLSIDNPLTRLLVSLADTLRRTTASRRTRRLLDDVVEQLSGAVLRPLDEDLVKQGRLSEEETHWAQEYELARGLVSGLLPNPVAPGGSPARTLLFSLDDVFERIIRKSLGVCLTDTDWQVVHHSPVRHFLTDTVTSKPRLRLRPDILVATEFEPRRLQVADAKWKSLTLGAQGLALDRSDVYQLSAYMNRYGLSGGMLLMPASEATRRQGAAPWSRRLAIQGSSAWMDVVAVDVHALISSEKAARERGLAQLRTVFTRLSS